MGDVGFFSTFIDFLKSKSADICIFFLYVMAIAFLSYYLFQMIKKIKTQWSKIYPIALFVNIDEKIMRFIYILIGFIIGLNLALLSDITINMIALFGENHLESVKIYMQCLIDFFQFSSFLMLCYMIYRIELLIAHSQSTSSNAISTNTLTIKFLIPALIYVFLSVAMCIPIPFLQNFSWIRSIVADGLALGILMLIRGKCHQIIPDQFQSFFESEQANSFAPTFNLKSIFRLINGGLIITFIAISLSCIGLLSFTQPCHHMTSLLSLYVDFFKQILISCALCHIIGLGFKEIKAEQFQNTFINQKPVHQDSFYQNNNFFSKICQTLGFGCCYTPSQTKK